jgi:outer membrane protein assembly factor BamD (BamD/ComL family)
MLISSIRFALILGLCLGALACASAPVPAPEGLSPSELIQRAQDASEKNNKEQAIVLYEAILERFPNDMSSVCAAEYEIAFIRYKQKRNDEAQTRFKALLARYEGPDAALLPAHYRILSEKILANMEKAK